MAQLAQITSGGWRFYRAFKVSTYLVVALGFASLLLSDQIGLFGALLASVVMVVSWPEKPLVQLSDRFWRLAAMLIMAYLFVFYSIGWLPSLQVASQLLIFLQVQRLYTRQEHRDYGYLYLIAFLQLLLGCILTITPAFAVILVGFLVSVTWALLLFQLKQGMDEGALVVAGIEKPAPRHVRFIEFMFGTSGPAGVRDPRLVARYVEGDKLIRWRYLGATLVLTVLLLMMTVLIFLIAPRLDLNMFRRQGGSATHVQGFSDEVTLGEVGEIKKGSAKVMRVALEGPAIDGGRQFPLYWRGMALDHFDGKKWSLSRDRRQTFHQDGQFLNPNDPPEANLIQRITLEPIDAKVLFALSRVLSMEADLSSVYRSLTGGFSAERTEGRLSYKVYSWVSRPPAVALREAPETYPLAMQQVYLQLPAELSNQVNALSQVLIEGQSNSYDKVMAVQNYLRDNFEYTLIPQSTGGAPLESFLFDTQSGHCEYFASAMVVLLRAQGIPARMVNGFAGGTYNPFGDYYVVTQGEAHSWVEVFFSQSGWIQFDPTPSAETGEFGPVQSTWALVTDYMETQWYFYVLDYGLDVQLEAVKSLFKELRVRLPSDFSFSSDPSRRDSADANSPFADWKSYLVVLCGALLFLALLRAVWKWSDRSKKGAAQLLEGDAKVVRRYLKGRIRLASVLGRLDAPRAASETSREWAKRHADKLGALAGELMRVEGDFEGARYGGVMVDNTMLQRLEAFIKRLEQSLKKN